MIWWADIVSKITKTICVQIFSCVKQSERAAAGISRFSIQRWGSTILKRYPFNSPPQQTRCHWESTRHRWRLESDVMCSLSYETYNKWEPSCCNLLQNLKGREQTRRMGLKRYVSCLNYGTINMSRKNWCQGNFDQFTYSETREILAKWLSLMFMNSYKTYIKWKLRCGNILQH